MVKSTFVRLKYEDIRSVLALPTVILPLLQSPFSHWYDLNHRYAVVFTYDDDDRIGKRPHPINQDIMSCCYIIDTRKTVIFN